jgi:hypothetical protein
LLPSAAARRSQGVPGQEGISANTTLTFLPAGQFQTLATGSCSFVADFPPIRWITSPASPLSSTWASVPGEFQPFGPITQHRSGLWLPLSAGLSDWIPTVEVKWVNAPSQQSKASSEKAPPLSEESETSTEKQDRAPVFPRILRIAA